MRMMFEICPVLACACLRLFFGFFFLFLFCCCCVSVSVSDGCTEEKGKREGWALSIRGPMSLCHGIVL